MIVLVKFEIIGENIRKSYMIFIANIHFTEIVKIQDRLNSQLIIILISLNTIAVCNYIINYTHVLYLQLIPCNFYIYVRSLVCYQNIYTIYFTYRYVSKY